MMTSTNHGEILAIYLCLGTREPMQTVGSAKVTNSGIDGDRHAVSDGARKNRQILIMDRETLDELGLNPGDVRENVTTVGIDLSKLQQGHKVSLGDDVILSITGPCAPCSRMDELRPGLQAELADRRGKLAFVVQGGAIQIGDHVEVLS